MSEKKGLVQEFKEFLTTGDLMSIAVAFIMGLAVKGPVSYTHLTLPTSDLV